MDYFFHIIVLILVYTVLSSSLDLIVGHAGQVSIAHASYFGIGAYTSALLTVNAGLPFSIGVISSGLLSAVVGVGVGIPSLRTRGDIFAIVTFAFQVLTYQLLNNLTALTGGPLGVSGIPAPQIFGVELVTPGSYVALYGALLVPLFGLLAMLKKSQFGRELHAIRGDDVWATSIGIDAVRLTVAAMGIGAFSAGIGGALMAHYISFVAPQSYTVMESVFILTMVVVGGAGSVWGAVVGSALLIVLPEALRLISIPYEIAGHIRQVLYGLMLVGFVAWRPRGLMGRYGFD